MSALSARDAYRLWAPSYDRETAISALENETVEALAVSVRGRTLLDVGCGTARRLRGQDAAVAVGIDLSIDMLRRAPSSAWCAAGDMRALPVASGAVDVVWCRLAIGHLAELERAYAELARVCRAGGTVIVTDLSPHAAGHRRTFSDERGTTHEVEHVVHSRVDHDDAAARAGLSLVDARDGVVGDSVRHFYADAGRLRAFDEQCGTRLVLALAWRKVEG